MSKFIRLIQNENMKLMSRAGTWVMFGLVFLDVLLNVANSPNDPHASIVDNFNGFISGASSPMTIITALGIIWAAGIMSSEFSTGTIKLLLIRPVSRTKILWAKYVVVVLYDIFLTAIYYGLIVIFGMILYPGVSIFNNDKVIILGQASFLFFLEVLFMITLTYMIAILSHNRSLALGLSMLLYYGNSVIGFFIQSKPWAKYLFFMNLDLTGYVTQSFSFINLHTTLPFSLCVLGVYFIVFLLVTWYSFVSRDVVN